MTRRYQMLALAFGILAATLAALAVYQSRKGEKTETETKYASFPLQKPQ